MIHVTSGVNKFSLLAIPFFVLAGALMAEGGISRRLVAFASVLVGFVRGGLSLVNILASTFFGAISGSPVADTASIGTVMVPEMVRNGYPRVRGRADHQRLDPGDADPAEPQRGHLFDGGGRLDLDRGAVHGRCLPRAAARAGACALLPAHRRQAELPQRAAHPAARGAEDLPRRALGADDDRDHPRRHPDRCIHRHRVGVDGRRCGRSSSRCSSIATTSGATCRS